MRVASPLLLMSCALPCALLFVATVQAAEKALVIRAGDLKATPFIDGLNADKVAANQSVNIVKRQGGWVQVETGGKVGWLRLLNVRMAQATVTPDTSRPAAATQLPTNNLSARSSLLRTGSSGKTVTTGIKGLDEENIRTASVDSAQVVALAALAVAPAQATANAKASGLKENNVEYLQKGKRN
jgi:hypothetical protein